MGREMGICRRFGVCHTRFADGRVRRWLNRHCRGGCGRLHSCVKCASWCLVHTQHNPWAMLLCGALCMQSSCFFEQPPCSIYSTVHCDAFVGWHRLTQRLADFMGGSKDLAPCFCVVPFLQSICCSQCVVRASCALPCPLLPCACWRQVPHTALGCTRICLADVAACTYFCPCNGLAGGCMMRNSTCQTAVAT